MKIIKTTTPLDTIEYDGDYPVNLDPVDVVEIFKTPLVGSYNWDYTVQDNRIKKLYELGKQLNWDVEIDVDWTPEVIDISEERFQWEDSQWGGHPVYKTWDRMRKEEFFRDLNSWSTSQFLHGEQGLSLIHI